MPAALPEPQIVFDAVETYLDLAYDGGPPAATTGRYGSAGH